MGCFDHQSYSREGTGFLGFGSRWLEHVPAMNFPGCSPWKFQWLVQMIHFPLSAAVSLFFRGELAVSSRESAVWVGWVCVFRPPWKTKGGNLKIFVFLEKKMISQWIFVFFGGGSVVLEKKPSDKMTYPPPKPTSVPQKESGIFHCFWGARC